MASFGFERRSKGHQHLFESASCQHLDGVRLRCVGAKKQTGNESDGEGWVSHALVLKVLQAIELKLFK